MTRLDADRAAAVNRARLRREAAGIDRAARVSALLAAEDELTRAARALRRAGYATLALGAETDAREVRKEVLRLSEGQGRVLFDLSGARLRSRAEGPLSRTATTSRQTHNETGRSEPGAPLGTRHRRTVPLAAVGAARIHHRAYGRVHQAQPAGAGAASPAARRNRAAGGGGGAFHAERPVWIVPLDFRGRGSR